MLIILIKWNDHENRPILSYAILLHNRTFLKLKLIFDISISVCKRASILKIPGFRDFLQTYKQPWLAGLIRDCIPYRNTLKYSKSTKCMKIIIKFIYDQKSLQTAKYSINSKMSKQIIVYPYQVNHTAIKNYLWRF